MVRLFKESHLLPMLLLVAEEAALGQVLQGGWRRRAVVLQAGWKVVPQGKVWWRVFARLCCSRQVRTVEIKW